MNERDQILKLIEECPQSYITYVKSNLTLLKWIEENTLIPNAIKLAEKIYSALYQDNGICEQGNVKKFHSIGIGYKGCGRASVCQCVKAMVSSGVKHAKSNYTPEKIQEIQNKIKSTMLDRYGHEYSLQVKEFKEKQENTNIERYGAANVLQLDQFVEKSKKTSLERYGVENPSQSTEIKEKRKQTNIKSLGVEKPVSK